jgi:hypothetical protein
LLHYSSYLHICLEYIPYTDVTFCPGEYVPSENVSLASNDLQSPLGADYVLSYRTYLSKAQKERVMTLIQEIQPEFTVYIATMRKTSVQPPGPYLVTHFSQY